MTNITYIGFDQYSCRYCFVIRFTNVIERVNFEAKFNLGFRQFDIQAEPDNSQANVEKVVFADENHKGNIKSIIERLLNES